MRPLKPPHIQLIYDNDINIYIELKDYKIPRQMLRYFSIDKIKDKEYCIGIK